MTRMQDREASGEKEKTLRISCNAFKNLCEVTVARL